MKYIIVLDSGLEQPIVFPEILSHKTVAGFYLGNSQVVSAGSCSRMGDFWSAYGRSVSLNLKSRRELDEALLNLNLEKSI